MAGAAPAAALAPQVYLLHQRIVDLEGYIHVDGHIYSVPYQLVGKAVEVRETKDQVRVFVGPREVAIHDKAVSTAKQRKTMVRHGVGRRVHQLVDHSPR